jgi:2-dehydro-3-deoxyphosphooctonate aldolase (KDO 8-P synthase)
METHPRPDEALSDGPNAWPLDRMEALLGRLVELDRAVKRAPLEETTLPVSGPGLTRSGTGT